MALFDITEADRHLYDTQLRDFLPQQLFDIHSHLWLEAFWSTAQSTDMRAVSWPYLVARDNSAADLAEHVIRSRITPRRPVRELEGRVATGEPGTDRAAGAFAEQRRGPRRAARPP